MSSALSTLRLQVDNTYSSGRAMFGVKVRASRAVLGLSQDEFGEHTGLTQRSVHRIERGLVEPKLRTMLTIEQYWRDAGIAFDDLPDGGFRLMVRGSALIGQ